MNTRQQLYKKYRISGMSGYRAAINAGYAHSTAWCAHKNIEKRCNMVDLMDRNGLTDDVLIEKLKDGLGAIDKVVSGKGQDKIVIDFADMSARHKYLDTALKLKGKLKTGSTNIQSVSVKVGNGNGKLNGEHKAKQEAMRAFLHDRLSL